MFERYTEKARRVVFFARYEASQYGSPYIETEHLLLGLVREDRAIAKRFLGEGNAEQEIRSEIEKNITARERISTSVEAPLTAESKKVLMMAAEEADRMRHRHIGTEHLLLGMLRLDGSVACKILEARGVKLEALRAEIAKALPAQSISLQQSHKRAIETLEGFLTGLKWHRAEDLLKFFAESAQFVDVHGRRWNLVELHKESETVFAPYAKKNAAYTIEETVTDTNDLLVVIVLWKKCNSR